MIKDFLKPAKYFFALSGVLMIASIVLLVYPGPKLSIEFTGGTRMEIIAGDSVTAEQITAAIGTFAPDLNPAVNQTDVDTFLIRTKNLTNEEHQALIDQLNASLGQITETQYTTIGPTVGATLKKQAAYALIASVIAIILYIAWSFRHIPKRYSSWRFGLVAIVTLLHDVLITTGIFVILSHVTSFEFDTLFVTAMLTIFGYSVNDTIIIFDRIRDNLATQDRGESFGIIANRSLVQSVTRSVYTGGAVIIMLTCLFFLGSANIHWFVGALLIGILLGTYSSLFVATPLLVYWQKRDRR